MRRFFISDTEHFSLLKLSRQLLCVLLCCVSFSVIAKRPVVLVIDSYHQGYGWVDHYQQGITEALAKRAQLHFYQLDAKRLPVDAYENRAEQAWQTYLALKPDVVILCDDEAVALLTIRISNHGTPVVYFGVNSDARDHGLLKLENVSGLVERPLFKRSLAYLRELLPLPPKKVLVLWDDSPTAQRTLVESFDGGGTTTVYGIQVEHRQVSHVSAWQQSIVTSQQQGFDAVVVGLYQKLLDEQDLQVDDSALLAWTSQHTPLPIFSFWDFAVGKRGTIGGLVMSGKEQGRAAAKRAELFIHKIPMSSFPSTENSGYFIFSREQLKRWQIVLPEQIEEIATLVE
ncbi:MULTISPECIES: ABC transporter substrate-binding protein [Corallincola]|uniref:Sugar ABC transporter n=4 Tax=Corallincola TaxID=1775176 RepID=A0A368NK03_9GAMM|nr:MULTISPECIES: sugar ABC transporter [Corallincola]RCU50937.1 sugar ABC transporter [Corallincola holothuriorum]TAA45892.1 sugar ABC transporter [Corallincola spongiicola]TCI04000.1 sugar ABC transporter [Corallincola luteus]